MGRLTDNGFSYKFKYTLDGNSVVYAINSVADLQALATYANSANNQYSTITAGKVFKLTTDIDLSGVSWTPIGNTDNTSFCGTFDGGGHVISNLTSTGTSGSRNGLFGIVNTSGIIKNVTLINANVSGGSNNGALVGYNMGTVTGNKYHANVGDVGYTRSTVNNTRLYTFTTTSGVTAEYTGDNDHKFTFDGKDYYASGATFKLTVDANNFPQYYKIRSVSGATANADGTYTATINGDLTVQVYGYPKIAGLAFDDTNNKYTVANTADFLMLASYVSGGGDISGLEFNFTATEYTINDLNELRALADYVNGGGDTSGLTFKLAQNIGGVNFHIGDSDDHRFKGTLDGDGHTISVNYNVTENYCALFNYVDGATIQKLTVDGTINTSKQCAAGIAAYVEGTTNITDCRSSVTITGTVDNTNGGVAAHGGLVATVANTYATLNLTNCIFDGKLLGSKSRGCGGLVGGLNKTSTANVTNCLFAPSEVTLLNEYNITLVRGSGTGTANLNGGYYTQALTDVQGTQVYKSLTLPEGVEATATDENTVKFGNTTYYVSGASITLNVTEQPEGKFLKGATRNDNGTYTYTIGNTAEWVDIPTIDGLTFDNTIGAFKISTAAELQALATYVNDGNDVSGWTFKLTADISGVNFHIGDSDAHKFKGTFDGNGYTISVNYNATTENCALFNYVEDATIQKLTVDGTINTSNKYAAGIAAQTSGTTTITDCRSSVTITGTISGDGTHGGLVGVVSDTLNITNSIFDGSLLGSSTNSCGGFVGWKNGTLNITNSLFAPTEITISTTGCATFARNGVTNISGGYYTQALTDVQGTQVYKLTLPKGITATGDTVVTFGNDTYAADEITLAGKTGYIFSGNKSLTVTEAVTVTGTATFDTENHYVLADDTKTLATTTNTADYPELIQVYELTLPSGVTASGDICITDGNKIYATGTVTLTATALTAGYVLNSASITVAKDTTVNAIPDPNGHYVFADGNGYTIATADNVAAYPELIQVYELTLPEGVTVNGGIHAVDNGVTYAAGNVTFDAGTGAAVKPVTVNTDIIISAADIYYTVTIPAEMEIVNNSLNDGDIYTGDNGITYYRSGAQLTLKLKDGYTAAAIQNGGDTLDVAADGTYGLTVSGVTTITGSNISWRDPPMSTLEFTATIEGATVTIQATGEDTSWTLSATGYEGSIDNYFSFDGTTFTVKQAAIDARLTEVVGPDTIIQLAVDQGVTINEIVLTETKEISGWSAADSGGFTYYSGKLGYKNDQTGGRNKSNKLTITNILQDKFTIAGTGVTAENVSRYFELNALSDSSYLVTPKDDFVNALSGTATITLTPATGISAAWSYDKTSPDITLDNSYTCNLSAYGAINDNTLTLHPKQDNAFTINGIKSGLTTLEAIGTITVSGDTVNIALNAGALDAKEVSLTGTGYTANFTINGTYTEYQQDSSSATGKTSGFEFTAGGETAGYKISSDSSKILYNATNAGGETFEIKGLGQDLSDYTLTVSDSGVITATNNNNETVNVGTVIKEASTFQITLNKSVVPTSPTAGNEISVTSTDKVSFVLTGLTESANKEATLTTQSERTPPPNQLRRCA